VLEFFLRCDASQLWVVSDFSGVRRHLDRASIEIEARIRGVELSEFFMDKLAVCERYVRESDARDAKKKSQG
jgi:hypothetical protein